MALLLDVAREWKDSETCGLKWTSIDLLAWRHVQVLAFEVSVNIDIRWLSVVHVVGRCPFGGYVYASL